MALTLCRGHPPTPSLHPSGSVDTTVYTLPHPIWQGEYVDAVQIVHEPPHNFVDKLAYNTVRLTRFNFDWMSGYSWGKLSEERWLRRIIFLETVAGVPGSVAAILRHLRSLRKMKRDHGWIHTLLVRSWHEVKDSFITYTSGHPPTHPPTRKRQRTRECTC